LCVWNPNQLTIGYQVGVTVPLQKRYSTHKNENHFRWFDKLALL
jgi:hypothetical protein